MDKEAAKAEIKRLVDKYNNVVAGGKLKDYKEENTKKDFITPLFRALGWDMENDKSLDEVSNEDQISKGRVDYAFRLNSIVKFYLEAKALNKGLDEAKDAAQAINYAWNKGTTWAVLTDFKTLVIYNADVRSSLLESQFLRLDCNQYVEHFEDLWLLSKPSYQENAIDNKAETWSKKRKKTKVGDQLLSELMVYRQLLSKNIVKNNASKNLNEADLDEAVQKIIDRLIFIRTTEDREIDPRNLLTMAREFEGGKRGKLRDNLNTLYKIYDRNYNSKLFTYDPNDMEKRHLCETLEVDNEVLITVINGLYKSKDGLTEYDFSAIDADVLGNIYEQYLSHILRKTAKRASVESKEAHRKEQGIYYTPTYIVDYIVRNTLSEVLKGKKPEEAEKVRVLDMACGSGSFLLKSFDIFNEYYKANDKDYSQTNLDAKSDAEKITRKTKILKNNIHGVDLDPKAVEIAQLNLLLKAAETKHRLPDLRENIKCGNSLIDQSLSEDTRAFDWHKEFHKIIDEEKGFDVIVGNPPYIKEFVNKDAFNGLRDSPYYQGKMDIWTMFACKAIDFVKEGGYVGFIAPNNWVTNAGASILRNKMLTECEIVSYTDFNDFKVFGEAGIQTMIFVIRKKKPTKRYSLRYTKIIDSSINETEVREAIHAKKIDTSTKVTSISVEIEPKELINQNIVFLDSTDKKILDRIEAQKNFTLDEKEIIQGIVGDPDDAFIFDSREEYNQQEKEVLKTFYSAVNRYAPGEVRGLIAYLTRTTVKDFDKFRNVAKQLEKYRAQLDNRREVKSGQIKYYHLHWPRDERFFKKGKKLICGIRVAKPSFYYTDDEYYCSRALNVIITEKADLLCLLTILNSKLIHYWLKRKGKQLGDLLQVDKGPLMSIPLKIPNASEQNPFKNFATKMLQLNEKLVKMGDKQTDERVSLEKEIAELDAKIYQLVYDLYGLTEEERKIVEEAVK